MKILSKKSILAIMLISSLILAGCSSSQTNDATATNETSVTDDSASTDEATTDEDTSDDESSESDNTSSDTEDAEDAEDAQDVTYPITIEHAFGETVIESKPERVVTISWGNQDTPLALGVAPVGVSKANYGVSDDESLLPWTADAFESLGVEDPNVFDDVSGLDFEAISDANPDVILAAYSGITQDEYDLLSQIAPVVAYPTAAWQTSWRDQILMDSKGMGMETEGQDLVDQLETLISEKTAEYPQLEGKKAAFLYLDSADLSQFYVYLPGDPRAGFLEDLGMEFPDSISELAESSGSFSVTVSAENADILNDVDIIVAYDSDGLLDALQADSLLGQVNAIKNGAVALIEDNTSLAASLTPSALSIPATIDDYLAILGAAADNVE